MKRGRQPEPELRYHSCVEAPEPMSEETQSLMPVEEEHGGGALRVILDAYAEEMRKSGAQYAEMFKKVKTELARKYKAVL